MGNNKTDSFSEELINIQKDTIDRVQGALTKAESSDSTANLVSRRRSTKTDSPLLWTGLHNNIWMEKNTRITFDMLTRLSYENSIVASVVNTRANQVSNFSRPTNNKYQLGYTIRLIDEEEEMSEQDRLYTQELEQWVLTCGSNEQRDHKDKYTFEDFLRSMTRDRLVYDQCVTEFVPDLKGDLAYFLPVDGASIRYVNENFNHDNIELLRNKNLFSQYFEEKRLKDGEYSYIQVYDDRPLMGFSHEQLMVKHANPVVKLGLNGYPIGELEQVINQITSYLFGETHTRLYFMQGVASKGILHIKDDIPEDELEAFRQHFYGQLTGTQNAFRTPIMAGIEDVKWINLSDQNRDMEWKVWMEFLIKIITGIYLIDPSEINFDIVRGGGNTINEGNRNAIMLQASKDKGLTPLLRYMENLVNDIIEVKDPDFKKRYVFEFTGIRSADQMTDIERWSKEIEHYKTINEVRRENDLPEIENGDIILSQVYIAYINAKEARELQAKMQEEMMEEGAGGEEGGEEEPVAGMPAEDFAEDNITEEDIAEAQGYDEPEEEPSEKSLSSDLSNEKIVELLTDDEVGEELIQDLLKLTKE